MINDEVIWNVLKHGFCSFKSKTRGAETLCRNKFNLNGKCLHGMCPLANSNYATVLEQQGQIVLHVKTIERAHAPADLWERIELPANPSSALEVINDKLRWWPQRMVKACKARFKRYREVLRNMRKIKLRSSTVIERIHKKDERRLLKREAKALRAAKLEQSIQKELLQRLHSGVYDSQIPSYVTDENLEALVNQDLDAEATAAARAELEAMEVEMEQEEEQPLRQKAQKTKQKRPKFVAWESDEEEQAEERKKAAAAKRARAAEASGSTAAPPQKKRRVRVEIEHEEERETDATTVTVRSVHSLLDW